MNFFNAMKIFITLLLFSFAINASAATAGTKIKIPCSQLKAPPYYTQYLIPTPKASSGWKCTAFVESGTLRDMKAYIWEKKGHSKITLVGVPMELITPSQKDMKDLIDDPKEPQPELLIRNFINVFSADHKYMENDPHDARLSRVNSVFGDPKAVFFSRSNAIVGVYYNALPKMNADLPLSDANVQHQQFFLFIDRPGHADTYLDVRCDKCFLKDLFPLIVDPVFNAPVPDIP
jgi:hypothetical protein